MAKTIWFDVTQIHECGGLLMGMIRVELEIGRHLVRRPVEQVRFYRSCGLSGRLLEVSPREVESDIQRLDSYVEPSPSRTPSAAWNRLTRQLARAIERLPSPVHTLFTVYSSLYEGWGLPVAESLALGKSCIASDASSLPEVGGDFPEYIDPTDVSAWADRLSFYIDNPDAVREREEKIRSEYVPPTREETARALPDHAEAL
jgi:hypothetical protein